MQELSEQLKGFISGIEIFLLPEQEYIGSGTMEELPPIHSDRLYKVPVVFTISNLDTRDKIEIPHEVNTNLFTGHRLKDLIFHINENFLIKKGYKLYQIQQGKNTVYVE